MLSPNTKYPLSSISKEVIFLKNFITNPNIEVGDYTIVHVGFAISKIDEATAEQTLADFRALGVLDEELASEEEAFARAAQRPQSRCPDGSCETEGQQVDETASQLIPRERK